MDQERLAALEREMKETKEQIRAKQQQEKDKADKAAEAQREQEKLEKRRQKERAKAEKSKTEKDDQDRRDKEPEKPRRDPEQKRDQQQGGQQCPVCQKWLRSSTDFALSQHMWSVHPDHPEAQERSQAYKVTLKERERSQGRESWPFNWKADNRQKSQSRDQEGQRWKGRQGTEPSGSTHRDSRG